MSFEAHPGTHFEGKGLPFKPTVDGEMKVKNPFLPKEPLELLDCKNCQHLNDVPIMMGYNKDEGLFIGLNEFAKNETEVELFNRDPVEKLLLLALNR